METSDDPRADTVLLQRWQAGDAAAGRLLVERHFEAVFRLFRRRLPPDEVADMVQNTFEACVVRRDALVAGSNVRAYLLGIARRKLYDRLMRPKAAIANAEALTGDVAARSTVRPSRVAARREQSHLLLVAMARLSFEQQLVLELYYYEDLRLEDIAATLNVPVGTVKSRLATARKRLREELERVDARDLDGSKTEAQRLWEAKIRDALRELERE